MMTTDTPTFTDTLRELSELLPEKRGTEATDIAGWTNDLKYPSSTR